MFHEECTHCCAPLNRAVYAKEFCSEYCRLCGVDALLLVLDAHEPGTEKRHRIMDRLIGMWTLPEYLRWLNKPNPDPNVITFPLVEDLEHWAEYGIHTAMQLGEYLDACCAREREKDARRWSDEYPNVAMIG